MHIVDSQLTLNSQHQAETTIARKASLERINTSDGDEAKNSGTFGSMFDQEFQKLVMARVQDSAPVETSSAERCCKEKKGDMLDTLLSMLLGQNVPTALQAGIGATGANDGNGPGGILGEMPSLRASIARPRLQFTLEEQTTETESCEFSASGNICLADGSQRQFDVSYAFERSEQSSRSETVSFTDPLVLDCKAPQTALSDNTVKFDLDCDGKQEDMRLPAYDSALLFLDRNHNGRADDGSELFGPSTGNGFSELGKLDSDGNGWIDSADPAFTDLRLWRATSPDHAQVQRLDEAGIGAMSTANAATPFTLKERGTTTGQQRSTGVWLGEREGAGTVRQIDLVTTPSKKDDTSTPKPKAEA